MYKMEIFVKPPAVKYTVPMELYNALTNDSSLQSSVMLQAMSILNIQSQPSEPTLTSSYEKSTSQVNATNFRSYSNDRNQNPPPSYPRNPRNDCSPYKDPNLHHSNPRYASPGPRNRTPSRERKPQDHQGRNRQSSSKERQQNGRQGRSNERKP